MEKGKKKYMNRRGRMRKNQEGGSADEDGGFLGGRGMRAGVGPEFLEWVFKI